MAVIPGGALCLIGAGEHAGVVADAAQASGWTIAGVLARESAGAWPMLGSDADAARLAAERPDLRFIIAVGNLAARQRIAADCGPLPWATIIHPSAVVSPSACLGVGVFIAPLALVHTGAVVGAHAIINSGVIVEHDVTVGDFSHIAPGAVIGGGATIGAQVMVGLGARVRDHITIGARAVVGMGAVVVGAVGAGMTVMGVPARGKRL